MYTQQTTESNGGYRPANSADKGNENLTVAAVKSILGKPEVVSLTDEMKRAILAATGRTPTPGDFITAQRVNGSCMYTAHTYQGAVAVVGQSLMPAANDAHEGIVKAYVDALGTRPKSGATQPAVENFMLPPPRGSLERTIDDSYQMGFTPTEPGYGWEV